MAESGDTIKGLYRHLFQTLDDLEAKKIDSHHANAVANVAQTIVNAGKLEFKIIDTFGGDGTGFLPKQDALPRPESLQLVNRWKSRA